jgi:hypothetical protein
MGPCLPLALVRPEIVQQLVDQFKVFHEMHRVREFQLVLCADVLECVEKYATELLENARVKVGRKPGGPEFLRKALVISERRSPQIRFCGASAGDPSIYPIDASAL